MLRRGPEQYEQKSKAHAQAQISARSAARAARDTSAIIAPPSLDTYDFENPLITASKLGKKFE